MKAIRFHQYGGPEELVYEDAPRPHAGEGEVLIRVHASSVNPVDCAIRAGYLLAYFSTTLPMIPGLDVSGVIEEVGPGVTGLAPGDEVYSNGDMARDGAYAEYVVVRAADVVPKPKTLDHNQAASLPHVSLTAWQMLYNFGDVNEGQTVLIHAAAGGVGHIAVQLAKLRGATVIGTASAANHEFLRELGIDEVIDYRTTPFEDVVSDVDIVLDCVGGDCQARSWQVLKKGGILVSAVQMPSDEDAAGYGVRQAFVYAQPPKGAVLTEITRLVDSGQLRPEVSAVLPLREGRRGQEMVEGRHTRGKVVLQVI